MKSFGLLILFSLLLNLSNCQTECPKTEEKSQTKGKPTEKEKNISLRELIRNIYNKYKKSHCDCGSDRCSCQKLTQASVLPCFKQLFKILLSQHNNNCRKEITDPCIPIDETSGELDYKTWVEELKNHKVKLYRAPKECDHSVEKPQPPKARTGIKIREKPKCKCEDDTVAADCSDCKIVVSEDKQSVWLICNNCRPISSNEFKEFTKTGCLVKCGNNPKTMKVKTCYLQLNDYRDGKKDADSNPFLCPSVSLFTRRKNKCKR